MAHILTVTLNPALDLSVETPRLALGEVNRTANTRLEPAGKGINVARVLARLGHTVTVTGLLGEANAAPFERLFEAEGLRDRFLRIPGQNRINVKIAESDGRLTDLNGTGTPVPDTALEPLQRRLASELAGCDAVVIGGSLPPGLPASGLARLVQQAGDAGIPVWLDTSGDALTAGVAARPFALKPNTEELSEWAGHPLPDLASVRSAARRLQAGGVAQVIVSLGADGVLWLAPSGTFQAQVPPVRAVSTVCAGDTLLAAMLHGMLKQWPAPEVLRFATALSAECVRHVGVGHPDAADLPTLLQLTRVQRGPGHNNTGEMPR